MDPPAVEHELARDTGWPQSPWQGDSHSYDERKAVRIVLGYVH